MSRNIGRRRLTRYAPALVLYARSAAIDLRAVEVANQRHSKRIRRLGRDIAQRVEGIADDQTRRAA